MLEITTVDEYVRECNSRANGQLVVLQFSAPWCVRCPPFQMVVEKMQPQYKFKWLHAELPDGQELQERFGVTKLPAVVLVRDHPVNGRVAVDGEEVSASFESLMQPISSELFSATMKSMCAPSLVLDADF